MKRLNYIGSIVLGLNDALVELTGTLAGSFALANSKIVAFSGLITGIAGLVDGKLRIPFNKTRRLSRKSLKSALYTGIAYIITVDS